MSKNAKNLIVGNWKMNPESFDKANQLFGEIVKLSKKYKGNLVVCPPFPFLGVLALKKNKNVSLGAQDVFNEKSGAFTGEVSSKMLQSLSVSYVILGHSERREKGETNNLVSLKIAAALKENLNPIVCIGEKVRDHEGHFFNVIKEELLETLSGVSKNQIAKIAIAYEPIWAIGAEAKGAMKPEDLHETVIFIKKVLADKYGKNISAKVQILYGGSVDGENAHEIVCLGGVSGLLVGRASLDVKEFEKILQSIEKK